MLLSVLSGLGAMIDGPTNQFLSIAFCIFRRWEVMFIGFHSDNLLDTVEGHDPETKIITSNLRDFSKHVGEIES
jgi:hypothetical protein